MNVLRTLRLSAVVSLVASAVISPQIAHATTQSVVVGNLVSTGNPNRWVFPVTLAGFDNSKSFFVSIATSDGVLDLPTTTGLTALTGYPALSGNEEEFGFSGSLGDVEDALAVVGVTPSGGGASPAISVSVTEDPGAGFAFWPKGNRYYEYVELEESTPTEDYDVNADGQYSWTEAKNAAETRTLFGVTGYLVTITSAAENDFVSDKTEASDVWIGAARRDISVFDNAASNPGLIYEWKTGPEAGTAFAKQTSSLSGGYSVIDGEFNAWAGGEPNNYQYDEDDGWHENYAVTNWSGSRGEWNDLPDVALGPGLEVTRFLVEYGGDAAFSVEQAESECGYSAIAESEPCVTSAGGGSRSVELAATGPDQSAVMSTLGGAIALTLAGFVATIRSRRRLGIARSR